MAEHATRLMRGKVRSGRGERWQREMEHAVTDGLRATVRGIAGTLRGGDVWLWARNALCMALLVNTHMPDGSNPFAVAAFAALLGTGWGIPSAFFGCVVGVALNWNILQSLHWWQVPACCALWMSYPFWRTTQQQFPLRAALITGVVMLIPLPFVLGGAAMWPIVCILGAVVAMAMVPVYAQVLMLMARPGRALRADEQFSALLALITLVLGAASLTLGPCNLGYALAVCITVWLAQGCGPGTGMVTGGMLGIGLLVTHVSPWLCAALAMGGALSGAFRTKRRWVACIAFLLGALGTAMGILGVAGNLLPMMSVVPGLAAYLAVPERMRQAVLTCAEGVGDRSEIVPDAVCGAFAYALEERVRGLMDMVEALPKVQAAPMQTPDRLQRLIARQCVGCAGSEMCWNANFQHTSRLMNGLIENAEVRELDDEQLVRTIELIGCERSARLPESLAAMLTEEKQLLGEQARRNEARALAGVQLEGLAQCMDGVARTLREQTTFLPAVKQRVQRALITAGIEAEVLTASHVYGKIEILVRYEDAALIPHMGSVLARAVGMPMRPRLEEKKAHMEVLFEQEAPLDVDMGLSRRAKHGQQVAGDSTLVQRLTSGRQLLALSDGMGSGPKARSESRATLQLLQQCLRAGYSRTQALSAVNGLLLSCAGEEMFATMDMCLLDLHSGEAAFEKLGACTSFVVRGGNCRPIAGETLPLGILTQVQPRSFRMRLMEGDLIVMTSDGVADAFPGGEAGMAHVLEKLHALPAQTISDVLMQRALQNQGECPLDDMTVLAARVTAQWQHMAAPVKLAAERKARRRKQHMEA